MAFYALLCLVWTLCSAGPSSAEQPVFSPWTSSLLSEYSARGNVAAYTDAVVAEIARNPANFNNVIAEAVSRAPEFRADILGAATRSFPGFSDQIALTGRSDTISQTAATNVAKTWSGEIEIGGSRSTGNTERDQASGAIKVKKAQNLWIHEANLRFDYAREDKETSARKLLSNFESRYDPSNGFYAFLFVQYEDDQFSGFDFELTESAGVGYRLIQNDWVTWSLELGPGGRQSVVSETDKTESEIVGRGNSEFIWNISETAKLTNDTNVITGSDRTTTENTIALSTTIIGKLLGRLSFRVRHNSAPPSGTKSTDTLSKISLAYEF
jgi:putative salt-induced outer membrane protein